jgi:PTS system fructose-specific IIC component
MTVDLQAGYRWQAIDELINNLLAERKITHQNRDLIASAVRRREMATSTGIGHGTGIPHALTVFVSEVVYATGRSKNGINFDALDARPVHKVIFFLVPAGQFQKLVNVLAGMVRQAHRIEL